MLNLAEPDEERFYRRHRARQRRAGAGRRSTRTTGRAASRTRTPTRSSRGSSRLIQPTIIRARTQPLEALGLRRRSTAIDTSQHPYPVSQTLYYAQGVLGLAAPPVFQNPNDPGGLGFLHAHTPAIVLGRAAFEAPGARRRRWRSSPAGT